MVKQLNPFTSYTFQSALDRTEYWW